MKSAAAALAPRPSLAPRVLVVEDEPSLALTLGDRLLKERYEVETRADGESALSFALRSPVDVIVLELMLPDIGRLRAAEGRFRGLRLVHTHLRGEPPQRKQRPFLRMQIRREAATAGELEPARSPGTNAVLSPR